MIQRIQTFYLSLIILLSIFLLNGSILSFHDESGTVIKVTIEGILRDTGDKNFLLIGKFLPLSAVLILIPLVSLAAIFLFRKRKIQMGLAIFVIILSAGLSVLTFLCSYNIISKFKSGITPGLNMALPFLILIFAILAYRGIRKDDRLVKSYDRLR